jgi:hypothetical protein
VKLIVTNQPKGGSWEFASVRNLVDGGLTLIVKGSGYRWLIAANQANGGEKNRSHFIAPTNFSNK